MTLQPEDRIKFTNAKTHRETYANVKGISRYVDQVTGRSARPSEIRAHWMLDSTTGEWVLSWVRFQGNKVDRSSGQQLPGRWVFAWKADRLDEAPDWVRRYIDEIA